MLEAWIAFSSPISSDTFLLGVFAAGLMLGAAVTSLTTWCARGA